MGGISVPVVVDGNPHACLDVLPGAGAALSPVSGATHRHPASDHAVRRHDGPGDPSQRIEIGLVNNMPDAAMEATVRQFLSLLGAAARDMVVHVRLFSLPGVSSSDWRHRHLSTCYAGFDELWDARLDGLIVTGTEPRAADLTAEPYWDDLARLVDWAEENTAATVWSCLAAHAAVLHLDGIRRSPLDEKCFGLFDHMRVSDHRLLRGQPALIPAPHSRWNELSETALASCGYRILSTSPAAGVDIFAKERRSLFLFFQGHPEYEADTLAREHRRDVGRFLRGERDSYPALPKHYFDAAAADALNAFRARATADRREELMSEFPAGPVFGGISGASTGSWHAHALCTYANWLNYIVECKAARTRPAPRRLSAG